LTRVAREQIEQGSPSAHAAIQTEANAVPVSAASGWELATKARLGQLLVAQGFVLLAITLQQGLHAGRYPMPHRDPFDRLLAAQAELNNLTLVTVDPALQAFPCRTLW
jgi:PIN domain nuclease of toxin-antitoxin system